MYQPKEYSEKEISIFEGIMALLNRGYKLHELKVADIAAAAGMGKSTAYEYFESKEELLREAVHYHVYKEYKAFKSFVSRQAGLMDMIQNSMDYLEDMLNTRFSGLLLMFLNLGQSELAQLIYEDTEILKVIRAGVDEQIRAILEAGKREGLIAADMSAEECRLILNGFLSAFCNEVIFLSRGILPGPGLEPPEKGTGKGTAGMSNAPNNNGATADDIPPAQSDNGAAATGQPIEQGSMSARTEGELIEALKARTMKLILKALK